MTDDDPLDLFGEASSESEGDGDAGAGTDPEVGTEHDDGDAPLEDLAREVRGRREARESQAVEGVDGPPDDDLFESVDVGDVDDEAVW